MITQIGQRPNLAIAKDLQAMTSYTLISHFQAVGAIINVRPFLYDNTT